MGLATLTLLRCIMRILIYDINYAPELTGVGKYTGDVGTWLAGQGHTVDVITALPYYPEWEIHRSYRRKWWFTETIEGVLVHRCPLFVPKRVTSVKRILHEFSFVLSSLIYWLPVFLGRSYDVVFCVAPPFHIGLLPVVYATTRQIPLWLHLQDLQIDMAKELSMLTNKRLLNLLFRLEKFILKRSDVVSTISDGMVRKVAEKNSLQSPCVLFPNWVDENFIKPLSPEESLRKELNFSYTDKLVLYSGSLGEKQGLELIIEAARHFASQPRIKFLICGSGGGKSKLEQLVRTYDLSNVSFQPLQPYEKLSALLAMADLHLVLQKKSASDLVLPSKLTSILAAGGCALVSAVPGTTLHTLIRQHNMGIVIEPELAETLIEGIQHAFQTDLAVYQDNARAYAKRYLSKTTILREFSEKLERLDRTVANKLLASQRTEADRLSVKHSPKLNRQSPSKPAGL